MCGSFPGRIVPDDGAELDAVRRGVQFAVDDRAVALRSDSVGGVPVGCVPIGGLEEAAVRVREAQHDAQPAVGEQSRPDPECHDRRVRRRRPSRRSPSSPSWRNRLRRIPVHRSSSCSGSLRSSGSISGSVAVVVVEREPDAAEIEPLRVLVEPCPGLFSSDDAAAHRALPCRAGRGSAPARGESGARSSRLRARSLRGSASHATPRCSSSGC